MEGGVMIPGEEGDRSAGQSDGGGGGTRSPAALLTVFLLVRHQVLIRLRFRAEESPVAMALITDLSS